MAWHDSLLRDPDGRVTGLISSGVDVTDRVRLEHELQRMDKLESLGTLAGGIAHDFNNMLTGIIGNINLARMEDDPERSRELLKEAEQEILQARGLSQQLLTFAKGGAPVRSVQDVAQILQEAVSFALRGSDVSPRFDLPADLWWANVDKGQLSQVFSNIVINADEAMPAGGLISVSARNIAFADPVPVSRPCAWRLRSDRPERHGAGIAEERPSQDLRSLLQHEAPWQWPGPFHVVCHHPQARGDYCVELEEGSRHDLLRLSAGCSCPSHPVRRPRTAPRVSGQGRVLVMTMNLRATGGGRHADPAGFTKAVLTRDRGQRRLPPIPVRRFIRSDSMRICRRRPRPSGLVPFNPPSHQPPMTCPPTTPPPGLPMARTQQPLACTTPSTPPPRASNIHPPAHCLERIRHGFPSWPSTRAYHFDGVLAKPNSFTELTSVLASLDTRLSVSDSIVRPQ